MVPYSDRISTLSSLDRIHLVCDSNEDCRLLVLNSNGDMRQVLWHYPFFYGLLSSKYCCIHHAHCIQCIIVMRGWAFPSLHLRSRAACTITAWEPFIVWHSKQSAINTYMHGTGGVIPRRGHPPGPGSPKKARRTAGVVVRVCNITAWRQA